MVAGVRLELTTFRVWTGCSSQLSYPAVSLVGRDDRIWTCDPLIPNQVHYQAVLRPAFLTKKMARPAGIEPTTFWSVGKRSIQLSYGRIISPRRITSVPVYNTRLFLFWQVPFSKLHQERGYYSPIADSSKTCQVEKQILLRDFKTLWGHVF